MLTQWTRKIPWGYVLQRLRGLREKKSVESWALLIGGGLLGLQGLLLFYSPWMAWLAGFPVSGLLWWFYNRCERLHQLAARPRPVRTEGAEASEAEWKRFVARQAELLPRAAEQLKAIAGQVERGVSQACESFADIAAQAKEAPSGRNGKFAKSILQAVVALQFQDIVSQRIQRVVEALGRLEKALDGRAHGSLVVDESRANGSNGCWPEHLEEADLDLREPKFVSEAVRREAKEEEPPEGSVELF